MRHVGGTMNVNGLRQRVTRVRLVAANTVRAAVRRKTFHAILLLAAVWAVGAQGLRELNFAGNDARFLAELGLGALALFGAALTIVLTSQSFFAEIERRTILPLLARPLGRGEYLLGQWLGIATVIAIYGAVMTTLLVLLVRGPASVSTDNGWVAAILIAGAAQGLKLWVLAALVLLIASFAESQIFTVLVAALVLVGCELQGFAAEVAARGGSSWVRATCEAVSLLLPDFRRFGFSLENAAASRLPLLGLYALVYVAVIHGLAVLSFRRRDL
ncbi:MAG TPA: ABC transporter permease [Opitutus sp.]|nr:ABC transporter permease [Opitutus sp.]